MDIRIYVSNVRGEWHEDYSINTNSFEEAEQAARKLVEEYNKGEAFRYGEKAVLRQFVRIEVIPPQQQEDL